MYQRRDNRNPPIILYQLVELVVVVPQRGLLDNPLLGTSGWVRIIHKEGIFGVDKNWQFLLEIVRRLG